MYGTCSPRLVYNEAVEARSYYKQSYFWRFRNLACGDLTGNNQIEKDRVVVPPRLVWVKEEEGWCDLACVKRL